jgi:hypothetical protein
MLGLSWHRITKGRKVILNLKSGGALRGDLVRTVGDLLELRNAEHLEEGGDPTSPALVDGSAIIRADNVSFAQALD